MKFTIETGAFASALKIASVAMLGGTNLPILGNIKIEADEGELTISSTNLELYVIQKVPAKVAQAGASTLPYSILAALVGRMTSSTVSIAQVKKEIVFKSGEVTANMDALDAEEFPPPLKQNRDGAVTVDASDILKPFSMLAHAMGDDPQRYALTGINLFPTKGGTDFAATNGHRLAVFHGVKLASEDVIAPNDFVRAILKIQPAGEIQVIVSDGAISIVSQRIEVTAKLIEAKFPNWRPAVPEKSETALSCGRKELISALQTCAIFADNKVPGLQLSGKGKEIEVSQPGKATAMVLGTELTKQPDISIRLNARYLIETLSVLEGDSVRIQCKDSDSPVMIEEGPVVAVINQLLSVNA